MINIHLYHTNDLHSHFENWPQIVTFFNQMREKHSQEGEPALFFDLGDHMDRANLITEGTLGSVNVALLNQINIDYATIGNNEGITFTKEAINKAYQNKKFPIILANLFNEEGTRPDWAIPYTIHTLDENIRIGITAMTAPFKPFYEPLGWKIEDPMVLLPDIIQELRAKSDIVILMSHLGLFADEQIAQEIQGIDAILGSHTHHLLKEGILFGETIIGQAGKFCQYVGKTTLSFNKESRWVEDRKMEARTIPYVPDTEAVQLIKRYERVARQSLSEPIACQEMVLPVDWFDESPFGEFMARALREWCKADLSMVNSGVLLGSLNRGIVTRGDIHELCPHPINPCNVILTGKDIIDVMNMALLPSFEHLALKGLGFRGIYLGKLVYDNVSYETFVLNGERQVKNVQIAGEELNKEKEYTVATLDTFTFGSLLPPIKKSNMKHYFMPEMLRDLLTWKLKIK